MIYNGMAPNLGRATNSNAGAAQLFHCVQHLLAARGDKRLKLARFFRLQLTGHLSRLSLELWRFRLQRRNFAIVSRFSRFVRVNVVVDEIRVGFHKIRHVWIAKRGNVITKSSASHKATRDH